MRHNEFGQLVPARVAEMARQRGCMGGTRYLYIDGDYHGNRPVASLGCRRRPSRFRSLNFERYKTGLVESWVAFKSPSDVLCNGWSHESHTFEGVPGDPLRLTDTEQYIPQDDTWLVNAVSQVELAIDSFLREFIQTPFLHRVEHSLHSVLCNIVRSYLGDLPQTFPIGDGTALTQVVHKEWPSPFRRLEKGGRRCSFDIAVLTPKLLANCKTIEMFRRGRLAAPIAIEMGLDYGAAHLAKDAEKLINSRLFRGYVVHLSRGIPRDPKVEEILINLEKQSGIRTAYVSWNTTGTVYKLINSPKIGEFLDD